MVTFRAVIISSLLTVLVAATTELYPLDLAALQDLYDSTNGTFWNLRELSSDPGAPWDFTEDANPCTDNWYGINCTLSDLGDVYRVNQVDLRFSNMRGTLPTSLQSMTSLTYLDMSYNNLHGTLPGLSGMTSLEYLDLTFNQFSGPIPDMIDQQNTLQHLSLESNYFISGTIPDFSAFDYLKYLNLAWNDLTGTVPVTLDLPTLIELWLDGNSFHGPVPDFPTLGGLVSLSVSYNYLSGKLPAFISRQENLTWLLINDNIFDGPLDDLIDTNEQTALYIVDVSHNPFDGPVPSWLFGASASLVDAGYNCFHGTLPATICDATQLVYLEFSCLACHAHCTGKLNSNEAYFIVPNPVHGTLPSCLFRMERLYYLDASDNYFTGSLPESMALSSDYPLRIDLSYNQLTGLVPESLQQLLRSQDSVHLIDISNNKLSGGFTRGDNLSIPDLDLRNNRMSGPSVEGSWVKDDSPYPIQLLDGNLFACKTDRSDLHPRDSAYERYDCGSDSVVKPLYALLACACTLVILVACVIISWKRNNTEYAVTALFRIWANAVLGADSEQDKKLPELRRVMKVMRQLTVVAVVCGLVAVVILAPMFATLTAYYGTHDYEYAWTVSSVLLSGRLPFALCFAAYISVVGLTARQLTRISPPDGSLRPAQAISTVRMFRRVVACTIYATVNFAVVGAVNVAFVAIETYATPEYQIAISAFKVGWNLTVAPFLSRYIAYELSAARADWILLELCVSVMCNIGIPLLAIVVVSPQCLFGLVGSQISSIYSPETYDSLMKSGTRPFHYSYQCSFQFVNNYVAAFEYMCLLTSFAAPLTAVLIGFLLQRTRPGGYLHNILNGLLPRVLRTVATDPTSVPKHSVLNSFFDCTQFFISQFTNLTMICTVGLVFPPLAATAAVAMVIAHCFAVLSLGRVMTNARASGIGTQYAQLIEDDCARVANPVTVRHAVWLLLGFCGVFYPIFLFDTLGDAVGVYESYWVLVAVPLLSLLAVFLLWALSAESGERDQQKNYSAELQLADLYQLRDAEEVSGEEGEGLVDALRVATGVGSKTDLEIGHAVGDACEFAPPMEFEVNAVENN